MLKSPKTKAMLSKLLSAAIAVGFWAVVLFFMLKPSAPEYVSEKNLPKVAATLKKATVEYNYWSLLGQHRRDRYHLILDFDDKGRFYIESSVSDGLKRILSKIPKNDFLVVHYFPEPSSRKGRRIFSIFGENGEVFSE